MRECAVRLRGVQPRPWLHAREHRSFSLGKQRQTALSCAADTVLAAQQDTARSLGVVLIFGVNHVMPFSVYRSGESLLRCLRQLLLSTDLLGFGTVLLLFWFLMFSLLCYWLVGGRGYSNNYSWLRRRDVKRCLVWSRKQGPELPTERDRRETVLLCCVAEK